MNGVILAKSPIPGRPPKTLLSHTKDIMDSVELLYGTEGRPTRLAQEWLTILPTQGGRLRPVSHKHNGKRRLP